MSNYEEPAEIDGVHRFEPWHEINRGDPIEALELLIWESELGWPASTPTR
ncbi:MAG: hypothetical protein K0U56_08250 [Actinomycetia bacterium]|nr:hypothetical protein [Actinomycetes bacterium]